MIVFGIFLNLLACAYGFSRVLASKSDRFSIALIALLVHALHFVLQPAVLLATGTLDMFLPDRVASKGLFIGAAAIMLFNFGWGLVPPSPGAPARPISAPPRDIEALFRCGLWLGVVGLGLWTYFLISSGGILAYYQAAHGSSGAWIETTAYIYLSPIWIVASVILTGMSSFSRYSRRAWRIVFWSLACFLLLNAILTGGRGPMAQVLIAAGGSILFARGIVPSRTAVHIGVAAGVLLVALMLGYRQYSHLGENKGEAPALREAASGMFVMDEAGLNARSTGIEFLYSASAMDAADETGKYLLGLDYLHAVTVHLIPRVIWEDKPYSFSRGRAVDWDDIRALYGWRVAGGSAPGLVADWYINFGIWSVPLWAVLGYAFHRAHCSARLNTSPVRTVCYILTFALSPYLFAQDFRQGLIFAIYGCVPVILLWKTLTSGRRRRMAPARSGKRAVANECGVLSS